MVFSWQELPKGFVCLGPMEGVTDTVFRQLMVKRGKPSVMFTEFTGVEQLFSPGYCAVAQNLEYAEIERPVIAQIWGVTPGLFYNAARLLADLGFDGVDINMGCPQRVIVSKGACSALIKNRALVKEIIQATQEGANDRIPVSVKIRIGWDTPVTEEWSAFLLSLGVDALTVHGRTTKEMSLAPADWKEVAKVVQVRDQLGSKAVVIGNGDVISLLDATQRVEETGVDGVMIARGVFHNPWLFMGVTSDEVSKETRLAALLEHVALYECTWEGKKHFDRLKRFFKIYLASFVGAVELRERLMHTTNGDEVREILAG